MDKSSLVELLLELNNGDPCGPAENFEEIFKHHIDAVVEKLSLNPVEIPKIPTLQSYDSENTHEWKYICLNFYLLHLLNTELNRAEDGILSVQETKKVKACLRNLLIVGILKNYQSNLPHFIQIHYHNPTNIVYNYEILKATINGFIDCISLLNLRLLIIPNCLPGILVGVIQLGYARLKKPSDIIEPNQFNLTEELYEKFKNDQEFYRDVLIKLRQKIHYSIFIVELMQLFRNDSPKWFKIALSKFLTNTLKMNNGIERITISLFDCVDDTTKNWKTLEILSKLIISCRKFDDFQSNICQQLDRALDKSKNSESTIFERLYVQCTKILFNDDESLCKTIFLSRILLKFRQFTDRNHKFREFDDITGDIQQTVRLIYNTFLISPPCLPITLLKYVIDVIFYFYIFTSNKTNFQQINNELHELFSKYLENEQNIDELFDNFLFNFPITGLSQFRRNLFLFESDGKIIVKNVEDSTKSSIKDTLLCLFKLLTIEQKIRLFGYLLRCVTNKEKYFYRDTTDESWNMQNPKNTILEHIVEIYKLLILLADDENIQQSIREKPDDIIHYFSLILDENYNNNPNSIFTVIVLLESQLKNSLKQNLNKYKILLGPIKRVMETTTSEEVRINCGKICRILTEERADRAACSSQNGEETEFNEALEDLCDPLLPVRGHALMRLAKFIEQKSELAMKNKQYLLTMFQLSLGDQDSYIYLNAVQGLAGMATLFPDEILETLCEEYSSFKKKSGDEASETRMKLGEVLVRIVKLHGDVASKYKALLLNTFLIGTKDDDHLMRASSLSNLGEVCRVLGYKLGTIVTEILVCVHAIIATDKAVEARRAAVTVIRQLFVGLESETIFLLKDDILVIYRTLKEIYYHDKDDVMRLQAQLALEELNANMKDFVLPKPQLNSEKKIIVLK